MSDPIGDFVVTAKDYRRKNHLDEVFASHPSGMPTEGDVQTPSLTQQPQAGIDPTQGSKPQKKQRGTRTVAADPGQPRDLEGEMQAATNADFKRQANAQTLQQNLAKPTPDMYEGRDWLRPSNDPLHEMGRTFEVTGLPGRAAMTKATGRDVGDVSKFDTANFLKKIGVPSLDELNPDAPFYPAALATSTLLGLGLGAVSDPSNFTPMGPAKKTAGGLKELARFGKKFPGQEGMGRMSRIVENSKISEMMEARSQEMQAQHELAQHTPAPMPTKGLDPTSVAAEAHAAFQQSGGQGVTWSPSQGNMAGQQGYAVSPFKELERRIPGDASRADFEQFIQDNAQILQQYPDITVGAWKSGDETVLDLTAVVPDIRKARQLGFMSQQEAIWDLANSKEIKLTPLQLEHYGVPGRELEGGVISPSKMGSGQGGGEKLRQMNYGDDFVERSFFYKKGTKPEHRFLNHPKYNVEVDPELIYDLNEDPLKLNTAIRDYTLREKAIKEAGYLGYTDPASFAGDRTMSRVVQLFENVRPKEAGLPELDARLAFLEETKIPFTQKTGEPIAAQVEGGQTITGRPYERPSDFTEDDHIMAQVYDAAPTFDERAVPAWNSLRDETNALYEEIAKKVQVEGVQGQPYASAEEMNKDIAAGHFKVSLDHNEHPLWSPEDNFKFRVVHDYLGHFEGKQDFSLAGEKAAYKYHADLLKNEDAKKALQVEVYGQAAAALGHGGEFQTQKVFLPDFEEHAKRTGELFADVGATYPEKEKLGARGIGVRNNVLVNAGAAVIHRGARDLASFKKGMETTGVVHATGAEVNWEKMYERSKKTYTRYVDALAARGSKLEPVRELTKRFKAGEYLKTWYNDARDATAEAVGVNIDEYTGLPDNLLLLKFVAATSPMQAVEPNIELALLAYKNYKLGEPWDARLAFNKMNLDRIVDGKPFTYDAGGIKVTDFYDALTGNPNSVVVDRHMMGAYGFKKVVPNEEYGTEAVQYFASPKQVGFIKSMIEQEAARWKVAPREYQAAVWVGQKLKIGLQPGEEMPKTFGDTFRKIVEKDPYFKYPQGLDEAGKANFAAMWLLTRVSAGALYGGEHGDTTRERLSNALVGAGAGFMLGHPKVIETLTGILRKSEAEIIAERKATRAETIFRLSGAGNDIKMNIGGHEVGINAARLGTPDGLKSAAEKVTKARKASGEIREGSRGVITNDEARRLGSLLGLSQDDVLSRIAGTPHAVEEVFAYADILEGSWNHMVVLAREVERDPANVANKTALQMFVPTYRSIGDQLLATGEEAARALQAHGAEDVMTAKATLRAVEPALDLIQNAPKIPIEKLAKVITSVDAGTFRNVSKAADTLGWDVFNEVLYFNLLSNPTTHVVNLAGSSILAPAVSVATRTVAAGTKYLHPQMSADEMLKNPLNAPVTMGEVKASIVGYLNGWAMASKAVVDSWKTASEGSHGFLETLDRLRDVQSEVGSAAGKFDQQRKPGISSLRLGVENPFLAAATDGLGSMVRSTSTALKLGDLISSNINYSMELYSLAYRKTMAMGLTGKDFDKQFANFLANPTKDIKDAAKQFAAVQTFTNALDGRLASMQDFLSHPLTKTIAPFVGTPTNIFRYNLSYLPGLNLALKSVREDIKAGGARADIVRAKMALGMGLGTGLLALAANGQITGNGPAEKSQREVWLKDHQPNSIKFGGKWYDLSRIDPVIGSYVGMMADAYEMIGEMPEATVNEMGVIITAAFFKNMTSKTWSESAFEFLDLMHMGRSETAEDLTQAFDRYVRKHAKLVVPGTQGVGALNQAMFDDTIREVATWMDAIKAQIPGWSKTLKPNLDYFGNVQKKDNMGPDLLSPIRVKDGKPDPVVAEIHKQRVELPTIPKVIDGQPLTSNEIHDFKLAFAKEVKIDGKNLYDSLERMITDKKSEYWDLPEDAGPNPLSHRSEYLKQHVRQYLDEAIEIMADKYENPKFLRLSMEIKKAKARGEEASDKEIKRDLHQRRLERGVELSQP